jgi:hypothetical protein
MVRKKPKSRGSLRRSCRRGIAQEDRRDAPTLSRHRGGASHGSGRAHRYRRITLLPRSPNPERTAEFYVSGSASGTTGMSV